MDILLNIDNYQTEIGKNIDKLMKIKKISQGDIKMICKEAGYEISQATISNAKRGNGNLTISNLIAISYALGVNIIDLFGSSKKYENYNTNTTQNISKLNSETLETNPSSPFFGGYIGDFHILFYKTSQSGNEMVRGTLHFEENFEKNTCNATLNLFTDDLDPKTGKQAQKKYEGTLIISKSMRAAYCYLVSKKLGEMCMLIMQYIYTANRPVDTAMAIAITTASGANRRPTAHRICLSRSIVPANLMDCIKGQLLMNTGDIFITQHQINELLNDNRIPDAFKKLITSKKAQAEICYRIPEKGLYDSSFSEDELYKLVSLVRANSLSPKYSKISRRSDEALYSLLCPKIN